MLEKKYESYTYSDLLQEYKNVEEKTATLKKDLIIEMAKRKELEGIEKKKIAAALYEDLKDYVSTAHIRNILSGAGLTDKDKSPGKTKKEIEEIKPILVNTNGEQELEEPEKQDNEDLASNLIHGNDDIIDQTHLNQEPQKDDSEKELDNIHALRELKIENTNLHEQLNDFERVREQEKTEIENLRATIAELEKENARLFNRNKELEEENNRLKQENRALRNPPKIEQPPADIASRFSSKSHEDWQKKKYYNLTKKK